MKCSGALKAAPRSGKSQASGDDKHGGKLRVKISVNHRLCQTTPSTGRTVRRLGRVNPCNTTRGRSKCIVIPHSKASGVEVACTSKDTRLMPESVPRVTTCSAMKFSKSCQTPLVERSFEKKTLKKKWIANVLDCFELDPDTSPKQLLNFEEQSALCHHEKACSTVTKKSKTTKNPETGAVAERARTAKTEASITKTKSSKTKAAPTTKTKLSKALSTRANISNKRKANTEDSMLKQMIKCHSVLASSPSYSHQHIAQLLAQEIEIATQKKENTQNLRQAAVMTALTQEQNLDSGANRDGYGVIKGDSDCRSNDSVMDGNGEFPVLEAETTIFMRTSGGDEKEASSVDLIQGVSGVVVESKCDTLPKLPVPAFHHTLQESHFTSHNTVLKSESCVVDSFPSQRNLIMNSNDVQEESVGDEEMVVDNDTGALVIEATGQIEKTSDETMLNLTDSVGPGRGESTKEAIVTSMFCSGTSVSPHYNHLHHQSISPSHDHLTHPVSPRKEKKYIAPQSVKESVTCDVHFRNMKEIMGSKIQDSAVQNVIMIVHTTHVKNTSEMMSQAQELPEGHHHPGTGCTDSVILPTSSMTQLIPDLHQRVDTLVNLKEGEWKTECSRSSDSDEDVLSINASSWSLLDSEADGEVEEMMSDVGDVMMEHEDSIDVAGSGELPDDIAGGGEFSYESVAVGGESHNVNVTGVALPAKNVTDGESPTGYVDYRELPAENVADCKPPNENIADGKIPNENVANSELSNNSFAGDELLNESITKSSELNENVGCGELLDEGVASSSAFLDDAFGGVKLMEEDVGGGDKLSVPGMCEVSVDAMLRKSARVNSACPSDKLEDAVPGHLNTQIDSDEESLQSNTTIIDRVVENDARCSLLDAVENNNLDPSHGGVSSDILVIKNSLRVSRDFDEIPEPSVTQGLPRVREGKSLQKMLTDSKCADGVIHLKSGTRYKSTLKRKENITTPIPQWKNQIEESLEVDCLVQKGTQNKTSIGVKEECMLIPEDDNLPTSPTQPQLLKTPLILRKENIEVPKPILPDNLGICFSFLNRGFCKRSVCCYSHKITWESESYIGLLLLHYVTKGRQKWAWGLLDRHLFHCGYPLPLAVSLLQPLGRYLVEHIQQQQQIDIKVPSQFTLPLDIAKVRILCEIRQGEAAYKLMCTYYLTASHEASQALLNVFVSFCEQCPEEQLMSPWEKVVQWGYEQQRGALQARLKNSLNIEWLRIHILDGNTDKVWEVYSHLSQALTASSGFFTQITCMVIAFLNKEGYHQQTFKVLKEVQRLRASSIPIFSTLIPSNQVIALSVIEDLRELSQLVCELCVPLSACTWDLLLTHMMDSSNFSVAIDLISMQTNFMAPNQNILQQILEECIKTCPDLLQPLSNLVCSLPGEVLGPLHSTLSHLVSALALASPQEHHIRYAVIQHCHKIGINLKPQSQVPLSMVHCGDKPNSPLNNIFLEDEGNNIREDIEANTLSPGFVGMEYQATRLKMPYNHKKRNSESFQSWNLGHIPSWHSYCEMPLSPTNPMPQSYFGESVPGHSFRQEVVSEAMDSIDLMQLGGVTPSFRSGCQQDLRSPESIHNPFDTPDSTVSRKQDSNTGQNWSEIKQAQSKHRFNSVTLADNEHPNIHSEKSGGQVTDNFKMSRLISAPETGSDVKNRRITKKIQRHDLAGVEEKMPEFCVVRKTPKFSYSELP